MESNNQLESDVVTLAQLTWSVLHRVGALSREEVARLLASIATLRERGAAHCLLGRVRPLRLRRSVSGGSLPHRRNDWQRPRDSIESS